MLRKATGLCGLAILVATALAPTAQAEVFVKPGSFEIGLQIGGYFFLEDELDRKNTVGYRAHLGYNFTELLGLELDLDLAPREVNADAFYTLNLDLVIHPMQHEWFVPFVGIGPSFASIVPAHGDDDYDPGLNAIVGVKLFPWRHVGFRIDLRYLARFGTADGEKTSHDLMFDGGLFVTFGGEEDTGPVLLDTDGDGFLDDEDACPAVPGVGSAKGCPDADADTVADSQDECPDVAGPPELGGCPDTDGDGLVDRLDRCPEIAGLERFKGCPDTDADEIADLDDRCPKIPGEPQYQGCPPPPPAEIVEKFSGRIDGITFEFDSDVIRAESFPMLDETVKILGAYGHLRLLIEGHTSSEGEYAHNMDLSRRRATAVKTYLVSKGIDVERLETEGFGPNRPISDNETEQGRSLNRRIEFKILRQ